MNREERIESIIDGFVEQIKAGEAANKNSLIELHPDLMPELGERLDFVLLVAETLKPDNPSAIELSHGLIEKIGCPHCGNMIALIEAWPSVKCRSCGNEVSVDSKLDSDDTSFPIELNERYTLQSELGRGSFGIVYCGFDEQLRRTVAIKVPRQGLFSNQREEARFRREAEHLAQLRHPGIVQIYDIGQTESFFFIVSELIDGVTLSELLKGSQLEHKKIAKIMCDICEALQHAHDQGVIHRDIKPSNILIDADFRPHLTDFGLSQSDDAAITITRDGQIVGTPAYMSPEQASAERTVDHRSDVYSAGATLYQMLAGEMPFRGSAKMLISQVLYDDPKPINHINENVPRDLETIAFKAMAKTQSGRYQTAAEMAADLTRWLNGDPIRARRPGPTERFAKWCRKRPVVAALSLVSTVLVVLLITGSIMWAVQANQNARQEARRAVTAQKELVQNLISQGNRATSDHTLSDGLRWFVKALAIEESISDTTATQLSRLRINQILFEQPALTEVLSGYGKIDCYTQQSDCLQFAANGQLRTLSCENFSIDQPIPITRWPRQLRIATESEIAVTLSKDNDRCDVYDLQSAKQRCRIKQERISSIDVSPDGRRVLTCSGDGSVKLWNSGSGQLVQEYANPGHLISGGRISPSGDWVVTWKISLPDLDTSLDVQDLSQDQSYSLPLKKEKLTNIVFVDDRLFFAYGREGSIWRIQRRDDGIDSRRLKDTSGVLKAIPLKSGKQLLTLNAQGATTLWNVETQKRINQVIHPGATDLAVCDDQSLYAVTGDELPLYFHWTHSGWPAANAVAHCEDLDAIFFLPDNRQLATVDSRGVFQRWDIAGAMRGKNVLIHDAGLRKARYSADGERLATVSTQNNAKIWQVQTGEQVGANLMHDFPVMDASFSCDGKILATGDSAGQVKLWDVINAQAISSPILATDAKSPVTRIVFSPTDQAVLAVGRRDGSVSVWKVAISGAQKIGSWARSDRIHSISFDRSGQFVQASSRDGTVVVWDVQNQKLAQQPLAHDGPIRSSAFSQDGNWLLTNGKSATIWDWKNRSAKWQKPIESAPTAKFSDQDKYFAAPFTERKTGIWSTNFLDSPKSVIPQGALRWCDFHSSLPLFAGSGFLRADAQPAGVTKIWDLRNGEPILPLIESSNLALQIQFGPNGKSLMTCANRGTCCVRHLSTIEIPTDDLIEIGHLLTGRADDQFNQPLNASEHAALFQRLSKKHPEVFRVSSQKIDQWNRVKDTLLATPPL